MKFTGIPPDPFPDFIETYFEESRKACPRVIGMCGKWTAADLIPGLSDFDTRLIFDDETSIPDWTAASLAVGRVHTELATKRPDWRRILEHLPGINLTAAELHDPLCYLPEVHLWSVYRGAVNMPPAGAWTAADEHFHLKRFATFFGPYQRGIDPPINLGEYENKYPLHSRYMHYFAPPVQSAVALTMRQCVRGKRQALEKARELFPHPEVIDRVLHTVDAHYEIASDYEEPELTKIEEILESYLASALEVLSKSVSSLQIDPKATPEELRKQVNSSSIAPVARLFELVCFARLMRGRLLFFAENIPWFDSDWLIRNELGRSRRWFYTQALEAYGVAVLNDRLPAEEVLEQVPTSILSPSLVRDYQRFSELASKPVEPGNEKIVSGLLADRFEPVQFVLELLLSDARRQARIHSKDHQYGETSIERSDTV